MNYPNEKSSGEILREDPISSTDPTHDAGLITGTGAGALIGGILGSSLGPLGAVSGALLGAGAGSVVGLGISKATDTSEPNNANNLETVPERADPRGISEPDQ